MCVKKGGVGFISLNFYFEPTPLIKKEKLEQKLNSIPTLILTYFNLIADTSMPSFLSDSRFS